MNVKRISNVPWSSLASLVLAIGAVTNPLDLIPMVAAIDDGLVAPALLVLAFIQFKKWKDQKRAMTPVYIEVNPHDYPRN